MADGRANRSDRDWRRGSLGQNFLVSAVVTKKLVSYGEVAPNELVVDLGAGKGKITQELLNRGARVWAVEADPEWAERLRAKFGTDARVIEGDMLQTGLPREPFKVVANLPFNVSTKMTRRLLGQGAPQLVIASLVVQDEYAKKRAGEYGWNLFNVQWYPWVVFDYLGKIGQGAFRPVPRVAGAFLRVIPRGDSLLPRRDLKDFQTFVEDGYTRPGGTVAEKIRSRLPPNETARLLGQLAAAQPADLSGTEWIRLYAHQRRRRAGRRGGRGQ